MKLYNLTITRCLYGDNVGQYTGSATFDDDKSKIELAITPHHANQILRVCAEGLLQAAKETADLASESILDSVVLLENKVEVADTDVQEGEAS